MSSVSSATSSQATSAKRYTGLSGMDTDSLVTAGLSRIKKKLDTTKQKKEVFEIQKDLYRGVIKDFDDFFEKHLDLTDSNALITSGNFKSIAYTSSNKGIVTASSSPIVQDISNFKVNVKSLASSASAIINLSDLKGQNHLKMSYLGKEIEVDIEGCKTDQVVAEVLKNCLKKYNMTAEYSEFAGGVIIKTSETGKTVFKDGKEVENTFTLSTKIKKGGRFIDSKTDKGLKSITLDLSELKNDNRLRINYIGEDVDIDIKGVSSNEQLASVINEKVEKLGMKAQVDGEGKVSLELTNKEDEIEKNGKKYTNNFTLISGEYEDKIESASQEVEVKAGTNLEATVSKVINGKEQTVSYTDGEGGKKATKNQVTIDGVTFEFNSIGEANLTGEKDVSKIKEKIVGFVNDYNKLIEKMNTLLMEKRDRNYQPLTDEQKDNMSEEQIKKWNEKVRTGQLAKDMDITNIINKLKYAAQDVVSGCGINLGNIGITLTKNYDKKAGTLKIDDQKLEEALKNDTTEVTKLFTNFPNNSLLSESEKYNAEGILQRMRNVLNEAVRLPSKSSLIKKAGNENFTESTLAKNIQDYEKKIKELKKEYDKKQQMLYSKYSRYEALLNKYNSQMGSLSQYFGSGQ